MSTKNVKFAEPEGYEPNNEEMIAEVGGADFDRDSRFKGKHSLDSDEEDDDGDRYDVLHDDDIEGQEEATVEFDQGIAITPFNMREELEEGHFDKDGMYILDKKKEIRDDWMDNIDWVKVKEREKGDDEQQQDSDEDDDNFDETSAFKEMLTTMKPGETVARALRRLGGGKTGMMAGSASARLKAKKMKLSQDDANKGDQTSFLKLTELSNGLVQRGYMEIYQDTYEKLSFKVKLHEENKQKVKVKIPEGMDDDDALDMFADDFDKKQGEKPPLVSEVKDTQSVPEFRLSSSEPSSSKAAAEDEGSNPEVMWEYQWDDKEESELFGPYTSEQMNEWAEDGYFKDGVMVRKVGSNTQFYNSRRIDFEIYM